MIIACQMIEEYYYLTHLNGTHYDQETIYNIEY